jgi:hypothetical protein
MRLQRPICRLIGMTPGDLIVIKISEFSTIAVLVAATAAVVAIQQHRERERRLPPPPVIEMPLVAPSSDASVSAGTSVDLAVKSQPTSQPASADAQASTVVDRGSTSHLASQSTSDR